MSIRTRLLLLVVVVVLPFLALTLFGAWNGRRETPTACRPMR
jgi:hypothetical protein